MSRAHRLLGRASLALVCLAACAACGSPDDGVAPVFRLIDEDPQLLFQRSRLVTTEAVFGWRFAGPGDLAGWELSVPPAEALPTPEGLVLSPQRQFVSMTREVDFDAADVDNLELQLRGLRRQPVTLECSGPGEGFSKDPVLAEENGTG